MRVPMVQIARFFDSHQPGWVECEFVDAEGRGSLITEKVPVVTAEDLDADSEVITTARPICLESREGRPSSRLPQI